MEWRGGAVTWPGWAGHLGQVHLEKSCDLGRVLPPFSFSFFFKLRARELCSRRWLVSHRQGSLVKPEWRTAPFSYKARERVTGFADPRRRARRGRPAGSSHASAGTADVSAGLSSLQ